MKADRTVISSVAEEENIAEESVMIGRDEEEEDSLDDGGVVDHRVAELWNQIRAEKGAEVEEQSLTRGQRGQIHPVNHAPDPIIDGEVMCLSSFWSSFICRRILQ